MRLKTTRKELHLQRGIIRPVLEVAASRDQKTKETEAAAFADAILQDALAAHDLLSERDDLKAENERLRKVTNKIKRFSKKLETVSDPEIPPIGRKLRTMLEEK